ncbi:MAG: ABC transporter ATP-binding protein [Acutalibacteraceae bacterium]
MKTNKIEVKGLCKSFDGNSILKDISFKIESGEFVAVMGQSGCGKSTLLYSVSGMDRPTEGEIRFDNRELSALSEREMQKLRLEYMGFIFQKPNFIKNLSIADNIVYPAFQLGKRSRKEIVSDAEALMKKMGIISVADHDIRKVSGGQLQRAAICRAMINHPDILFGDEPTGALDSSSTKEVMDILEQINFSGTTILLVTHDAKVASRADRIIYLEDGKIKDELRQKKGAESNINEWLAKMGF